MSIIRQDIIGQVSIQANGERRAQVEFEFDDGRVIRKNLRAPDAAITETKINGI